MDSHLGIFTNQHKSMDRYFSRKKSQNWPISKFETQIKTKNGFSRWKKAAEDFEFYDFLIVNVFCKKKTKNKFWFWFRQHHFSFAYICMLSTNFNSSSVNFGKKYVVTKSSGSLPSRISSSSNSRSSLADSFSSLFPLQ